MTVARYELRSAAELGCARIARRCRSAFAAASRGARRIATSTSTRPTTRSGARGIVCRLRIGARAPHRLSLRIAAATRRPRRSTRACAPPIRPTRSPRTTPCDGGCAALVDPAALVCAPSSRSSASRATRSTICCGRPRLELHSTASRCAATAARGRASSALRASPPWRASTSFQALVRALEAEHDARRPGRRSARAGRARCSAGCGSTPRATALREHRTSASPIGDETDAAGVSQPRAEPARVPAPRARDRRRSAHAASRAAALPRRS